MDWQPPSVQAAMGSLLFGVLLLTTAHAWSLPAPSSASASVPAAVSLPIRAAAAPVPRRLNEVSPYLDLALCPIRSEPWTCARQQSARILDSWDGELYAQWQKLKVEADRQMNATIERRGYSASELPLKEKPSTILKKIEIGTNYMKKYLAESMDGFLGREYEYLQTSKATPDDSENDQSGEDDDDDGDGDDEDVDEADAETAADTSDTAEEADQEEDDAEDTETDADADADAEADDEEDDDDDASNNTAEREPEGGEDETEPESENGPISGVISVQPAELQGDDVKNTVFSEDSASTGAEFIELVDGEATATGAVKKPGGGGKRKKDKKTKKKRKRKGQHGQSQGQTQPSTLVVVQAAPEHHEVDSGHDHGHGHGHGGGGSVDHDDAGSSVSKPHKRKQKKRVKGRRKRKGQHSNSGTAVEHEQSDLSLGLGLLDDLTEANDELLGGGGKRKHRNPIRYGRSNGVTRGKKKKKKKALAKYVLVGSFLKAKIELLLKILGAHLQVKFFAIALIGLLINIARFWIDVKRGSPPSKHHYEDHGDDWSEQGSYWKRSLQTDPSIEDVDSSTDSYQIRAQQHHQQQPQDSHYLAYRNQPQWQ
ncbi:high mobility group nucleosome-binding domain-containing protein 5 [Drosophila persimilis]|uniref:high mobility group nucleosome-binding domain-containing protein 5 n=1 Tax=Drosophila persimilis TaxID=7234 RepID=UPI000F081555|nr:high mobility group nucleosome-binding domain-containing protein 5 [Drosophila persimilis]